MKKVVKYFSVCLLAIISCCLFSACGSNIKLKINFDSNGGTNCSAIYYEVGKNFNMPSDPTKENYIFDGWYEDNGTWEKPFTTNTVLNYPLNKNMEITVYAHWLNKIHISFNSNGGSECDNIYLDSKNKTLPTPTKQFYVFDGWYLDNGTFKNEYTLSTDVTPDENNSIVVYAKWKLENEEIKIKTVYYQSNFDLEKNYDTFLESLTLYQPNILGQDFKGWYYDSMLTHKAPDVFTNEMVSSSNNYIVLYASFQEKEVEQISILGNPQTEYQYGEKFNANNAKILINYKDKNFEDDVIDLTEERINGFYTTDEYFKINRSDSYDSVKMSFTVSINNSSTSVYYIVHSDIDDFYIDESELIFVNGGDTSFRNKNIVACWTDKNGETGTTRLTETPDYKVNYYISNTQPTNTLWYIELNYPIIGIGNNYRNNNLSVDSCGTFTAYLRYHFKTIEVTYTVLPNENVVSGRFDENIYLNDYYSLANRQIYLYDSVNRNYIGFRASYEDIIEDVDTSSSGEKVAKVIYNNKELEITYYVIDLNEVESVECDDFYYNITLGQEPYNGFRVMFKLSNGKKFTEYIANDFITVPIDTSSLGKKYAKFTFQGIEFEAEYVVSL
ncbi:MAG: InlB B-repeat-containing protein [Clostridia bacterium]|nr:InlB B-repeat-containing protein [Clostridia bacterium]